MVKLDRRTAEYIIATGAAIDFLLEGKFANPIARAVKAAARRALPIAGRAGISVAGSALGATRLLMANPYILGGTAIYVGVTERDKIRSLLEQGYDIIEERLPTPSPPRPSPGTTGIEEIITSAYKPTRRPTRTGRGQFGEETLAMLGLPALPKRRKKPSAFNKAVSQGMSAIKKSTSYGKRGIIKPAQKAFALVTKLAAAKKKKKKAPKNGIRRKIWMSMKGLR